MFGSRIYDYFIPGSGISGAMPTDVREFYWLISTIPHPLKALQ